MKENYWMCVEDSGNFFTDISAIGPYTFLIRTGLRDRYASNYASMSVIQVSYQELDPELLAAYKEFVGNKEQANKSPHIKTEGKVGSKAIELLEWFWDAFDTIGAGYAEQDLDLDGLSDKLYEAKRLVREAKG